MEEVEVRVPVESGTAKLTLQYWLVDHGAQVAKGQPLAMFQIEDVLTSAPTSLLQGHSDLQEDDLDEFDEQQPTHDQSQQHKPVPVISNIQVRSPVTGQFKRAKGLSSSKSISKSDLIGKVEFCSHPSDYLGVCITCGADVTLEQTISGDSKKVTVGGNHTINFSEEEFARVKEENTKNLLRKNKLLLVLDLDHTLLHATMDTRASSLFKTPFDIDNQCAEVLFEGSLFRFTTDEHSRRQYHIHYVKFRKHTVDFLKELENYFDIHVFTLGIRSYAQKVVSLIDPERQYIKGNIVARDDLNDAQSSEVNRVIMQKKLHRVYPCDESLTVIVDDDVNVWNSSANNVMVIPQFRFWPSNVEYAHGVSQSSSSNSMPLDIEVLKSKDDDTVMETYRRVLTALHRIYFHRLFQITKELKPDVRDILQGIQMTVLKDHRIVFSGVFPLETPMEKSKEVICARKFGASVHSDVSDHTTLLIAARLGSKKCDEAKKRKIPIVSVDWLWISASHFSPAPLQPFLLPLKGPPQYVHTDYISVDEIVDSTLKFIFGNDYLEISSKIDNEEDGETSKEFTLSSSTDNSPLRSRKRKIEELTKDETDNGLREDNFDFSKEDLGLESESEEVNLDDESNNMEDIAADLENFLEEMDQ